MAETFSASASVISWLSATPSEPAGLRASANRVGGTRKAKIASSHEFTPSLPLPIDERLPWGAQIDHRLPGLREIEGEKQVAIKRHKSVLPSSFQLLQAPIIIFRADQSLGSPPN